MCRAESISVHSLVELTYLRPGWSHRGQRGQSQKGKSAEEKENDRETLCWFESMWLPHAAPSISPG